MLTMVTKLTSDVFAQARNDAEISIWGGTHEFHPIVAEDYASLPNYGAPLILKNVRRATIRGVGNPFIYFTGHGNGLLIQNCEDLLIEGVTFMGQGPLVDQSWYFALVALAGRNRRIRFRNCTFLNSGNHGVAHLYGPRDTCDSEIVDCRFENGGNMRRPILGKDGAAIALGGNNNQVSGCTIKRWLRGVELECGSFPDEPVIPTSCRIENNLIEEIYWQGITITPNAPGAWERFKDIVISGNVIRGWGMDPPPAMAWGGKFLHEGIYCTGGKGVMVAANSISDMWDGNGVRFQASHGPVENAIVIGNVIRNCGRSGVLFAPGEGASPDQCRFNRVTGNSISESGGYPVWLDGERNDVSGNTIQMPKPELGLKGWIKEPVDPSNVVLNNRIY